MSVSWQDVTAAVIVASALIYLGRRVWRARKPTKTPRCASCHACDAAAKTVRLIPIKPVNQNENRSP